MIGILLSLHSQIKKGHQIVLKNCGNCGVGLLKNLLVPDISYWDFISFFTLYNIYLLLFFYKKILFLTNVLEGE